MRTEIKTLYSGHYFAKERRQQELLMFKGPTMCIAVCLGSSNTISLHDEIKI